EPERVSRARRGRGVKVSPFLLVLLLVIAALIMLLLMIMIIVVRICSFILAQELSAPRKPFQHSHEHVNNSHESFFCGNNSLCSDKLSRYQYVKACGALQG